MCVCVLCVCVCVCVRARARVRAYACTGLCVYMRACKRVCVFDLIIVLWHSPSIQVSTMEQREIVSYIMQVRNSSHKVADMQK